MARRARRPAQHGVEHRLGEPAGEGVLLRGVVAAEHGELASGAPQHDLGAVAEARAWAAGRRHRAARAARSAASQPKEPRQTTARSRRQHQRDLARRSQGAQVSRSSGVGWLSGGAQRTAATIRVPTSRWPSPACIEVGWSASPTRCSEANSQSPERSPVKIRPVRLPPFAAGASPTISTAAWSTPQPGIGPAPVGLAGVRRPLVARHVLAPARPAAGRPGTPRRRRRARRVGRGGQPAHVRRVARHRRAGRAGSSGQPVPGGTGDGWGRPVTGCGRSTGGILTRA